MEHRGLKDALAQMTQAIAAVLKENQPSIYLYGSCVLDDFQLGWSDIDMLVLTRAPIAPAQAEALVTLRQTMLAREAGNPYYRSFEGGMLSISAFLSGQDDRVVYWGTSGQRITDRYEFDSFCMTELLEHGQCLYGEDVRPLMAAPSRARLMADVGRHAQGIRRCARALGRSLYSYGWLLDIARGMYTLRTGKIAAKTAAGEWALEEGICPDRAAMSDALRIRKHPLAYRNDAAALEDAQKLGPAILRFLDVLDAEWKAVNCGGSIDRIG